VRLSGTLAATEQVMLKLMPANATDTELLETSPGPTSAWLPALPDEQRLAENLVALANSLGGRLTIGVTPEGIEGVSNPNTLIDLVLRTALNLTPPLILPIPQTHPVDGRVVIVVDVPQGLPQVFAYRGTYVQRAGTANVPLDPAALRVLLMERGEHQFEDQILPQASLDDLDWEEVRQYLTRLSDRGASDMREALAHRGCLKRSGLQYVPTVAGILLFGKAPQRFIPSAEINAVRFSGVAMSDRFTRQEIHGCLPRQIRLAETFLVDHLRSTVTLQAGMRRDERLEYPLEAAREVVVNAVAHRDYAIRGDSIRLLIFSDRMEVYSPGKLPGPVTVENIRDERFSRNPVIVQVLSDMGYIERLGYGVDRIFDLMQERDWPAPDFRERASGFSVTLRQVLINEDASTIRGESPEALFSPGMYSGIPVNSRQEQALRYLHDGNTRITNSDLSRLYPDVHPETIRRDLAALVKLQVLNKLGQKRGSYYILARKDARKQPG
jgi:ATP-dependent DNA helicase RecG